MAIVVFYATAILLQLTFPAFASGKARDLGEAPQTVFKPIDHGGGAFTTTVAEDSRGHIYAANELGTLHYDGREWQMLPDTGYAPFTSTLAVDEIDRIWVGGFNHFGCYSADGSGNLEYRDYSEGLLQVMENTSLDTIWDIFIGDGGFYLVTGQNVVWWDQEQWYRHDFSATRRVLPTWLNGKLYVYSRGSGLFLIRGSERVKILEEKSEFAEGVMRVLEESNGILTLGTLYGKIYETDGTYLKKIYEPPENEKVTVWSAKNSRTAQAIAQHLGVYLIDDDGSHHFCPLNYI